MKLRSLLFVAADRPERFAKAAASSADALIPDLEDSVAREKDAGRAAIAEWLAGDRAGVTSFVRVNPLDGALTDADLEAVLPGKPEGLLLPKAEGAKSVEELIAKLAGAMLPILPIATESPAAIFQLGSYEAVASHLAGLTWGAEDLPAAIGAVSSPEADGSYTAPYEMVRSLTLFGAHAAGTQPIKTVFPRTDAPETLGAYVARARRDGFTGMMAIHPAQVGIINEGFTPTEAEVAHAHAVIDAFAANPGVGALKLDGKMIDRPHLVQAQRIMAQVA